MLLALALESSRAVGPDHSSRGSSVAAAQGNGGSVAGTVNNATPGGMLPVGAPVVLQFFSEGA